ncbi:MAG: hypothetical protein HY341_00145 [Candidatus Kerfeldbacteria bacterium]|nr:hypothetical protein [Candidatus Kerfeldbacteria bacterium]
MPDFLVFIDELLALHPLEAFWRLFLRGGWISLVYLAIATWYKYRLNHLRRKHERSIQFILLAIDIPKDIEPNLKAVEQIFAHFAGIKTTLTFWDRYWLGKIEDHLSLEIISVDGYIQFLIRTPDYFRDMVEAAVYAQYPEAQITQVDDYTIGAPRTFPDTDYEVWGTEFRFRRADAYPIRTYPNFEYGLTQTLADPMASILEILSRITRGEQLWLQLVIEPAEDAWRERGERIVKKLIGARVEGGGRFDALAYWPRQVGKGLFESATASVLTPQPESVKEERQEPPSKVQFLSPGDRAIVESMQMKMSKIGFLTSFRFVYLAPREIFSKERVVNGVVGALSQFTVEDMNGFKRSKYYTTKKPTIRGAQRYAAKQHRIMRRYVYRWPPEEGSAIVLNTEELASLFHFPTESVKAPLVKKMEAKRGEPPVGLPTDRMPFPRPLPESDAAGPPENLPL